MRKRRRARRTSAVEDFLLNDLGSASGTGGGSFGHCGSWVRLKRKRGEEGEGERGRSRSVAFFRAVRRAHRDDDQDGGDDLGSGGVVTMMN